MRRSLSLGLHVLVCACAAAPAATTEGGTTTGTTSLPATTEMTTGPGTTESSTSTSTAGLPTTSTTASPTGTSTTGGAKFDLGAMPDINDTGPVDESTCELAAMNLTSAGCLFAPTVGDSGTDLPWAVVAANTSGNVDANVTLYGAAGEVIEAAAVAPKQLHTFILPALSAALTQHAMPVQTGVLKQVLRLESDVPVVAYQFSPYSSSQVATADASLLLPAHAWGQDYLVPSYHNSDFSASWVSIVSMVDGNEVTVEMPTGMQGGTEAGGGVPGLAGGGSSTHTVDAQQALRIVSPSGSVADFTGMRVSSTAPVAVMTGSPAMSLPGPGMNYYKDYLEEQVPPRTAWGKDYAVVKFRPRSDEPDLYRFIADKDGTVLTFTGDHQDEVTLDEGQFHELLTAASFRVEGTEAFMVAHYMLSQDQSHGPKDDAEYPGAFISKNCDIPSQDTTELGDPAITFIPPTAQHRSSYTFLTPETYGWDMLTVVAPEAGWNTIELDGTALPSPTPLGVGDLAYARFLIPDGPHDIRSQSVKFGIEVYGYDCRISYAYPGGLSLGEINQPPG
ncbi:IgGFc-binding protein [Nannocystis sp. ILAH1]|uniref:IgGFc-binding protein n=1 Tax=unclassified Nannocystis TaxID=2627009 RepID=UPI00226E32E0|nr:MULTISPECIES: IgGFc-binding protein [unclassified Nannocystis]MCY0987047.1 IgGFc-binding protein [Nannocystis sp. ILAH1]MCY1071930.1 IgGFc-binding protein [Nannocystis sp. RBIL2]